MILLIKNIEIVNKIRICDGILNLVLIYIGSSVFERLVEGAERSPEPSNVR